MMPASCDCGHRAGRARLGRKFVKFEGFVKLYHHVMEIDLTETKGPAHDAAKKIQAVQRRRSVRIQMRQQNDAALVIQGRVRSRSVVKSQTNKKQKEEAAAKIQAVHRGNKGRAEMRDRKDAAARIQAVHRGNKGRDMLRQRDQGGAVGALTQNLDAGSAAANSTALPDWCDDDAASPWSEPSFSVGNWGAELNRLRDVGGRNDAPGHQVQENDAS